MPAAQCALMHMLFGFGKDLGVLLLEHVWEIELIQYYNSFKHDSKK